MFPTLTARAARAPLALAAALVLGGCASTAVETNFTHARAVVRERTGVELRWLTTDEARQQARADVDAILARPLGADDAVRLALAQSPGLQAALFQRAADSAESTQSARLPNPVIGFERLLRGQGDAREVEVTRSLTVPLLELLLLPARLQADDLRQRRLRSELAADVLRTASTARVAWVRAVAARQDAAYAARVRAAADASGELARRMEAAGNFSKLQRAREQAYEADAVVQQVRAQAAERAARETLVRALGLDAAQAARLQLPDRLPDLPAAPAAPGTAGEDAEATSRALAERLDVQVARAQLDLTARELGLTRVTSWVDGLDVSAVRTSDTGQPVQHGFGLELKLPLFDLGDARREGAGDAYLAALHRTSAVAVRAASELREAADARRASWEVARHYRDDLVPLRQAIADEDLLRYNGMLIGVFELLADARDQVATVRQALEAQRDFWLADAALQDAQAGLPTEP